MNFNIQEESLKSALKKVSIFIGSETNPAITLYRNPRYNDEPLLYQFTASIKGISYKKSEAIEEFTAGVSFNKEKAAMKVLGEAIERYCLASFNKNELISSSIQKISDKGLDISKIVTFSKTQLKNKKFNRFKFTKDIKLKWVRGYSLTQKKQILVPAQLVYVPYRFHDEPIIRFPITTGAATGTSLGSAIIKGICEVVERDAFMIFYLNKLTPPRIDISLSRDKTLSAISKVFTRYSLELYVFDITTNIRIASVMAIIVDRTGIGPAVSVGLKSSLDPKSAIVGAIEEAQQVRSWIRDESYNKSVKSEEKRSDDVELKERGLYWAKTRMIKYLDFFLRSKRVVKVDNFINKQSKIGRASYNLNLLIREFKRMNFEVCFVDVTRPEIKKAGFYVVKVIIPQLQPLYLFEEFKYLGGGRLYNMPKILGYGLVNDVNKQLNKIPHPFL